VAANRSGVALRGGLCAATATLALLSGINGFALWNHAAGLLHRPTTAISSAAGVPEVGAGDLICLAAPVLLAEQGQPVRRRLEPGFPWLVTALGDGYLWAFLADGALDEKVQLPLNIVTSC